MIEVLNNSLQGLQTSTRHIAKAADNIANPQLQTEFVEDIVDIKINEHNFTANAIVLETTKDLQDDLLEALDVTV